MKQMGQMGQRSIPMNTFAFIGERPSMRAVQIGATWENGRLAGKTLRDTLASLGIDPDRQCYLNLYMAPRRSERDRRDEEEAITQIRRLQTDGYVIVGMGQI